MKLIEQSVVKVGYDPKRLPLGQLDKETVMEGYKYLREIEKVLNGKAKGDLADLSSMFYTYIPHNFSMKHMSNFTIKTHEILKEKLDLIQNLIDIKIAHTIVNVETKAAKGPKVNQIDENYSKLNCEVITLADKSDEFKMIEEFLTNTKGHYKLKLLDAFKINRAGEEKTYNP
jgi:poly [ADP-ribose] polymerase